MSTVTSLRIPPTGLRFENIDKRYGGLFALRRVSLEIAPGECVILAGRNGSGKTTLLRIAAQIVKPTAGKLSLPGANSAPSSNGTPGYVAHATMVYDELTAEENLLLFARLQNVENPAGPRRRAVARSRPDRSPRFSGAHLFPRHAPAHGHCARSDSSPLGAALR